MRILDCTKGIMMLILVYIILPLPVICSNNGGLDEILEGYKYKYSPYAEGELERAIKEFIEDSVENVEEQQRILIKNMSRFSAKNMVKEYEKIWDELINEGR